MDPLLFYGYEILSALVPFLILFFPLVGYYRRQGNGIAKTSSALILLFVVYVTGVYHFTGAGTLYEGLRYHLDTGHNLIPFSHVIDPVGYSLNVLLFVPLGLLVPMIWERLSRFPRILGIGAAFSLFIELTQLLNIRATDIDDLIMNTAGAVIGFGIYRLFDRVTGSRSHQKGVPLSLLFVAVLTPYLGRFFLHNDMGLAKLLYGF